MKTKTFLLKEPLIKSSMSRVADKIAMIARSVTKVVAETTMPRSATPRARDLAVPRNSAALRFVATRMGSRIPGGLRRCARCEGDRPFAASHALHPIPEKPERGHVGLNQRFLNIFALLFLAVTFPSYAEDGVTQSEIVIGMSNALSGPAAGLGTQLKTGATAYFDKINAAGGVHGRKIRLISYDDGYEPEQTAAMTRKLIEQDKVFALFGYVGTPTSAAAVPFAGKMGVPYIAPFTGAEALRNPVNPIIFHVRASYFDETEGMVERLTKDLGIKKIGVFIQDDGYGNAGKAGVNRALNKRGLALAGEGKYTRNTTDVDAGLAALKAENPEAVIMVGTYKACAAFVKKARASGFNPRFLNVSFVGTSNFISEAGSDGEGVYITQVMPSPFDPSAEIVKQYQAALKKADKKSEFDFTSLEGYVDAVVLVEALKKTGPNLTRLAFLSAFEGLNIDLGGLKVAYSSADHQGSKSVFYTVIKDGKAMPISKF